MRFLTPLLACALAACSSSTVGDIDKPAEADLPQESWIATLATSPAAFDKYLRSAGRDGWIAYHANQLPEAVDKLEGPLDNRAMRRARSRVLFTLALLYDDLARASAITHERFFIARNARSPLPDGSPGHLVATLAQQCEGRDGAPWSSRVAESDRDVVGVDGTPPWATDAVTAWAAAEASNDAADARSAFLSRLAIHREARETLDPVPLLRVARDPVFVEAADGFDRPWHDPCLLRTLADVSFDRAARAGADTTGWRQLTTSWTAPSPDLGTTLFSSWLTVDDLRSELETAPHPGVLGATMPSLESLGVSVTPVTDDDLQSARDEVHRLDDHLRELNAELIEAADDDESAILTELQPMRRFRQDWLVVRARQALLANRPNSANAYVELATDPSDRTIGPANGPSVFALQAEARLRQNRTREALDALQILSETYPEILGLRELAGTWAALQTLDRSGDSKEN